MDTMRLRTIQQPASVEKLLESFAATRIVLPADAYPLLDVDSLTAELKLLIRRTRDDERAWRAWSDDRHVWFLFGELSLPLSRERGRPVLRVSQYDEAARIQDTAVWLRGPGDTWERCGV